MPRADDIDDGHFLAAIDSFIYFFDAYAALIDDF